jgi:hypothetical protein
MKIRQGFVSNSSSSSFVLGKSYMTDEQIDKFSRFTSYIEDFADNNCSFDEIPEDLEEFFDEETRFLDGRYPQESQFYFFGDVDESITRQIVKYLQEIGVDKKYYIFDL